jgi:hypothetical protein
MRKDDSPRVPDSRSIRENAGKASTGRLGDQMSIFKDANGFERNTCLVAPEFLWLISRVSLVLTLFAFCFHTE